MLENSYVIIFTVGWGPPFLGEAHYSFKLNFGEGRLKEKLIEGSYGFLRLFKKNTLPLLFCSVLIIPNSNNFLLIFVIPTLYIYLLCVYSFLSSFLFILNKMYSIKGHIIRLLYLCPFHFFFAVLISLNILYSYLLSGKIKKYKIQIYYKYFPRDLEPRVLLIWVTLPRGF